MSEQVTYRVESFSGGNGWQAAGTLDSLSGARLHAARMFDHAEVLRTRIIECRVSEEVLRAQDRAPALVQEALS